MIIFLLYLSMIPFRSELIPWKLMRPTLDLDLNPFPGRRTHFARPTKLPHGAASKFQPFPQQKTATGNGKAYWIPTPVETELTDKKRQIRGLLGEKSKTAGIPGKYTDP
jgi:hypothetical protein